MVKSVSGYVTNDGVFFAEEPDAVYYEARKALEEHFFNTSLFHSYSVTCRVWIESIEGAQDVIINYIKALRNDQNLQQDGSTTETANKVDRGRVTGDTSLDPDATDQDEDIFDHGHSGDT